MKEKDNFEDIEDESESDVNGIINGDDSDLEDDEGSDKRFFMVLGVIIGILVLIIAGFFILKHFQGPTGAVVTLDDLHRMNIEGESGENNYVYNGFSFVYFDGLWYTQIQRKEDDKLLDVPLHFGPKDLEDIEITGKIDESFKKNEIYITFDPTKKPLGFVALSAAELSLNLAKGIGIMPIAACLNNDSTACEDRPIITCDSGEATIYIKQDNETGVMLDENCVIIQGKDYDLIRATDRFLLQWYTIMK